MNVIEAAGCGGALAKKSPCVQGAMRQKTFRVKNEPGFPARGAAALVHIASTSRSEVWVERNGERRNGRSILDVLSLGMPYGSEITVSAEGEDEEAVIQRISDLLETAL